MTTRSLFVFGASRGIGLGLAETFAARGWSVVASERTRSEALHALAERSGGAVRVVTADVTEPASYADLGIGAGALDLVVLNAGISGPADQSARAASREEIADIMVTNAFAPAEAARALLPLVREGGTVAFLSSLMGSIADSSGGYPLYRSSKAALNMLAKGLAVQEAAARGIAVRALHPGWVQTDMGGPAAPLSVEDSTAGLAEVLSAGDTAGAPFRFLDYTGKELPF